MKYNIFTKLLAGLLAIVCLMGVILGGVGVIYNVGNRYYTSNPTEQNAYRIDAHSNGYAEELAEQYLYSHSGMPKHIWQEYFGRGYLNLHITPEVDFRLTVRRGSDIATEERFTKDAVYFREATVWIEQHTGTAQPVEETQNTLPGDQEPTTATAPVQTTVPTQPPQTQPVPTGYDFRGHYSDTNDTLWAVYQDRQTTEITVELFYTEEQYLEITSRNVYGIDWVSWLYAMRYRALLLLTLSGIGLALCLCYLAGAAGRNPDNDQLRPAGLNRLPLDLYTALALGLGVFLVYLLVEVVFYGFYDLDSLYGEPFWVLTLSGLGLCAGISTICVLYWCAFWAQVKADGFWWKRSLTIRFGGAVWRFFVRLWNLFWGLVGKGFRRLWGGVASVGGKVNKQVPGFTGFCRDLVDKIPYVWQILLTAGALMMGLALLGAFCYNPGMLFLYVILASTCMGIIAYFLRSLGEIRKAAKRMSQGELDAKVNTAIFDGWFLDFAKDLNALSDACVDAAREQMKSERMKTELITNVSHDIKTPLTSIINYVDLLKKAETEEERREYLEVLDRQSERLKKLIEDLMEMSKAATGNMAVELAPTDVTESIHQALGEFSDRLADRRLTVVLRKSGESILALCDGKLLWRVLSNLLTNVVKYALPGTRVYLDVTQTCRKVQISLKNISDQPLNVTAEELMERFVRGDESRNTEGNGLGLNIARSLMENQNGDLTLTVDGDLFKVLLTLPAAEGAEEEKSLLGISCN
ncbi:MAG: HAMP domain-containing histidine kinase [Oscillospiraceae bacterium]|nr:HAMP domain-containing histidine kinase [Oscillospiraceae bacterium]